MAHLFWFLSALAVVTVLPSPSIGFPTLINLERLQNPGPYNHTLALLRDQARVSSLLSASITTGVPKFQLNGTLATDGFYYTRIQLGTPPRELTVQIDTGSDVLWVRCISCRGCPTSPTSPSPYDYRASASGSAVSCIDQGCRLAAESSCGYCSSSGDNLCSYTIEYGDQSMTSGYYVRDVFHSDLITTNSTSPTTTPIIFGCSTEAARFAVSGMTIDGILGLGKNSISVVAQLASKSTTPRAFTHCLRGDPNGGGVLVFGAAVDPDITYTPLITSAFHYNVNLMSVSVNNQFISLDRSTFASPSYRGAMIDSGTTQVFLADEAYDRLVRSVTTTVSGIASPVILPDGLYYSVSARASADEFPHIRLDFEGGAYISLAPRDYLQQTFSMNESIPTRWRMQIGRSHDITIIGDIALKDKIVVYDLAAQRIGWANYDCSLPITVSTGDLVDTGNDHAQPPERSVSVMIRPVLWTIFLLFGIVSVVF